MRNRLPLQPTKQALDVLQSHVFDKFIKTLIHLRHDWQACRVIAAKMACILICTWLPLAEVS